jgi:hypothetical protein
MTNTTNMTINSAIEAIEFVTHPGNITDETIAAAREAMEFLNTKSRFTADQKSRVKTAFDQFAIIAEDFESEASPKNMSEKLKKAREERYVVSVSASGNKSYYNGDDVAVLLEGKSAKEVCELADEFVPMEGQTHMQRYAGLNEGATRMNAGNKLRGAVKRGELVVVLGSDGNPSRFKVPEAS